MATENPTMTVTGIRPGFVDTLLMKADKPFWVSTPEHAATYIVRGGNKKKRVVDVTPRRQLIAWFMRLVPDFLCQKL